jgi:hypothetical protein
MLVRLDTDEEDKILNQQSATKDAGATVQGLIEGLEALIDGLDTNRRCGDLVGYLASTGKFRDIIELLGADQSVVERAGA